MSKFLWSLLWLESLVRNASCAHGRLAFPGDAGAQTVTQPDTHVSVSEGDSVELRCNYSYGGSISLFWYVQHRGQGPHLLLKYFSGDTLVHGLHGFEAEFKKSESSFHLRKPSVQLSDAARYWCALSATAPGAAGGAVHKPPLSAELRNSAAVGVG